MRDLIPLDPVQTDYLAHKSIQSVQACTSDDEINTIAHLFEAKANKAGYAPDISHLIRYMQAQRYIAKHTGQKVSRGR